MPCRSVKERDVPTHGAQEAAKRVLSGEYVNAKVAAKAFNIHDPDVAILTWRCRLGAPAALRCGVGFDSPREHASST